MKPTPFAVAAATVFLASATTYAGNGYFTALGRMLGYGISDGYHVQRYCLPTCDTCSTCSSMSYPVMQQPMATPACPQCVRSEYLYARHPLGYHATIGYQPHTNQAYAPGYVRPAVPFLAAPYRNREYKEPWKER